MPWLMALLGANNITPKQRDQSQHRQSIRIWFRNLLELNGGYVSLESLIVSVVDKSRGARGVMKPVGDLSRI